MTTPTLWNLSRSSWNRKVTKYSQQKTLTKVLLDVVMSYVFNGLGAMRGIRNVPHLKAIPLVLVSAIASSEDQGFFPADDRPLADFFVPKAIESGDLLEKVEEFISHRSEPT